MFDESQGWKIQIRERPGSFIKEVFVFRSHGSNETEVLLPDLQGSKIFGSTEEIPTPTMILYPFMYQLLVDALHGAKPSEGKFTEGKLEATEKHLEDMRKLLKL